MAWIDGINQAFSLFLNGKVFDAVLLSYTNILGMWFYALVMFLGMGMIYIKTQNFGTVIITGIILSSAAIPFMPTQTLYIISIIIALGISLILYRVFHG